MRGTILSLRAGVPLPIAPGGTPPGRPLDLVVPYTNPSLAAGALSAALEFARGFDVVVTLLGVHVLPYPSPLESERGIRQRLEAELIAVARPCPVSVRAMLVFARDRDRAFLNLLRRQSLVIVGVKKHWWRTREERFARKLSARGYSVAVIKVK